MNTILLAAATWLHLLATVTVIGVYLVMFLAVTPAVMLTPARAGVVYDAYRRAKPLVLVSWLTFIVTGIALMLLNDAYAGFGQFNNLWSILMLVKHVVVLAMILMSGLINECPVIGLMRPLESALKHDDAAQIQTLLRTLHARERVTMLMGVTVLLLTAAAELG
jgi:uncharacterized membrane protein